MDTNVLFDDPVMVRDSAQQVLNLLGPAHAILVFSPVVLAELDRKRSDDIEDLRGPIGSRIKKLARLAGVTPTDLLTLTDAIVEEANLRWRSRWNEILAYPQVEVASWPDADAHTMASRELGRRRPFIDKDTGTIGHRDTLIWLGVLELAREDPDEGVIFVTADKGFLGDSGLHAHLADDLIQAGIPNCVNWLDSLPALVAALQKESESSGWEAWREPKVAEVLYDLTRALSAEDFVEHWDQRDSGTMAPTFDIGLPFTGHDWTLSEIDGPQHVELEDAPFGADELICTFVVDVYLGGFMDKFEWYSDDHPEVELWDADWNNQLVSIEANRRVRFRAKLEIDDAGEYAAFTEFLEASAEPEHGSITLG